MQILMFVYRFIFQRINSTFFFFVQKIHSEYTKKNVHIRIPVRNYLFAENSIFLLDISGSNLCFNSEKKLTV